MREKEKVILERVERYVSWGVPLEREQAGVACRQMAMYKGKRGKPVLVGGA